MELEPKRTKLENCSPVADVKDKRFVDLTGSPDLASCSRGYVPPNTQANTQWSVKTFNSWMDWRIKAKPVDPVPKDILTCGDAKLLNKWLSLFVLEARKLDGTRYPTSTLNMLLSGLKRYMVKANPSTPNLCKDTRFFGLRGTRDTVARKLREDGVGSSVRHAAVFSYEEEESLWKAGTLGVESPKTLLNAIFYMNGKVLCLRGGREHKSLKISQFNFSSDQGGDFVVYTENGSKNRSGTYKEKAGDNKVVKDYANTQPGNRCYVFLLCFYLQKLAPKVLEDPDSVFYRKPRDVVPASDSTPWFTLQVIGQNVLACSGKRMFQEVGIDGKTNHSLRATGATRLFEANVPRKTSQRVNRTQEPGCLEIV